MRLCISASSILLVSIFLFSSSGRAQSPRPILRNGDFEQIGPEPWIGFGKPLNVSTTTFHSGKQSLEISSGSTAQTRVRLKPNSRYTLTVWVKTGSGSDQVQLHIKGLGENNKSQSTALADWVKVETPLLVQGQSEVIIELEHPESPSQVNAWADDIAIDYVGEYSVVSQKQAGIKAMPSRVPQTQLGIIQQPNEKLDWLLDARFGLFIHWGLYAGPARGEWYMENAAVKPEEYRKLAYPESGDQYFDANQFDANAWASLAKAAGMKYMNLTTMHHDGYGLFSSAYMNAFTSKQSHNRDFVKEYVAACRANGLRVGIYKTLINWRFPGYFDINGTDAKKNKWGYSADVSHKENARLMKEELYCQVKELMTKYGKIDQIYWDGGWLGQQGGDADAAFFWESGKYLDTTNKWPINRYFQDLDESSGKALGLMGMVRKHQPDVLVNPRCGWYGDYRSEEGSSLITGPVRTEEIWEKNMTIGGAWGYSPVMEDPAKIMALSRLKRMLADCVIRNMALLLNVGPDRHGVISKAQKDRLLDIGKWIKTVEAAIYKTRGGPWNPKDGEFGFAYHGNTIYLFLLDGFKQDKLTLPALNAGQKLVKAYRVNDNKAIKAAQNKQREITLTDMSRNDPDVEIIALELNTAVLP